VISALRFWAGLLPVNVMLAHTLAALCARYGLPGKDEALLNQAIEAAGFPVKRAKEYIWQLPARFVGPYAEIDAVRTLELFEKLNPILDREGTRDAYRLEVDLPADFAHYAAYKGSVAINGISLTIAELLEKSFAVWIIPHTKRHTNIDGVEPGAFLNIEFDILAKYVERMLARYAPQE